MTINAVGLDVTLSAAKYLVFRIHLTRYPNNEILHRGVEGPE